MRSRAPHTSFQISCQGCIEAGPSSPPVVMNGNHAAVEFNDRISPGQVAVGSLAFGMFNPPGDDLPTVPGFQNLPLSTAGPILFLLQQTHRRGDLFAVAALRVLGMLHAGGPDAASGEQQEKQSDNPESGHPPDICNNLCGLRVCCPTTNSRKFAKDGSTARVYSRLWQIFMLPRLFGGPTQPAEAAIELRAGCTRGLTVMVKLCDALKG